MTMKFTLVEDKMVHLEHLLEKGQLTQLMEKSKFCS